MIREHIKNAFPEDKLLTEETFDGTIPVGSRVWMVDPLDGTKCYVDPDSTDFCVMIGLCINGSPSLGVVLEPATGVRWKGICIGNVRRAWRVEADGMEVEISALPPKIGPLLRFT
ncbi:hypothetical protein CYMTET_35778, partial [Cymbomonas tetramitiformis]